MACLPYQPPTAVSNAIFAPVAQMLAPDEGNRVFLASGEVRADN